VDRGKAVSRKTRCIHARTYVHQPVYGERTYADAGNGIAKTWKKHISPRVHFATSLQEGDLSFAESNIHPGVRTTEFSPLCPRKYDNSRTNSKKSSMRKLQTTNYVLVILRERNLSKFATSALLNKWKRRRKNLESLFRDLENDEPFEKCILKRCPGVIRGKINSIEHDGSLSTFAYLVVDTRERFLPRVSPVGISLRARGSIVSPSPASRSVLANAFWSAPDETIQLNSKLGCELYWAE